MHIFVPVRNHDPGGNPLVGDGYSVDFGSPAADRLAAQWSTLWIQAVVIADSNTMRLCAPPVIETLREIGVEVLPLEFPAGERSKTRATWGRLQDAMLAAGIEHGACVVAVGGGVVLDLAGFVAATYLRGIPHVNVPTTLLAQVDAAIGGKTGVNTPRGKNLVGAYHFPAYVLIDRELLCTLSPREMRCGLAEAVKHGVVADAGLFAELEALAERGGTISEVLLTRCVQVKAFAVGVDVRDRGRRRILNFGHTAGHAIEAATRHRVAHGEAVAMGMMIEGRIAQELCGFPQEDLDRLESVLARFELPVVPRCSFEKAVAALGADKKTERGRVRCALPLRLGQMEEAGGRWVLPVSLDMLQRSWNPKGRR